MKQSPLNDPDLPLAQLYLPCLRQDGKYRGKRKIKAIKEDDYNFENIIKLIEDENED